VNATAVVFGNKKRRKKTRTKSQGGHRKTTMLFLVLNQKNNAYIAAAQMGTQSFLSSKGKKHSCVSYHAIYLNFFFVQL